jgi:hypothetical protein
MGYSLFLVDLFLPLAVYTNFVTALYIPTDWAEFEVVVAIVVWFEPPVVVFCVPVVVVRVVFG